VGKRTKHPPGTRLLRRDAAQQSADRNQRVPPQDEKGKRMSLKNESAQAIEMVKAVVKTVRMGEKKKDLAGRVEKVFLAPRERQLGPSGRAGKL